MTASSDLGYRARLWRSSVKHRTLRRLRPTSRSIAQQVSRALSLPPTTQDVHPGAVWGVAMVKNEADVIEASIRHLLSQGVDEILIADNRSDDGTLELLRALSTSLPIHVATDQLVAYHQAEKMTQLARAADRLGASFVIPFDADEFWFAENGTVVDFLQANRADVVRARIHNIFPLADLHDGIDKTTRFRIDLRPHELGKVAFRSSPGTVLHMGNHGVHRAGRRSDGLIVAHLPWRSYEQLRRKTTIGGAALDAAGVPGEVGSHWRSMAAATDSTIRTTWSAILAGEQANIGWGPHGPFGLGAVLGWSDWSRISTIEKEDKAQ